MLGGAVKRWLTGVFFQAEDGIRDYKVTGVQTCALPIWVGVGNGPFTDRYPNGIDASGTIDRKSTRLNSSHLVISYAVFCLKQKKKHIITRRTLSIYHTTRFFYTPEC